MVLHDEKWKNYYEIETERKFWWLPGFHFAKSLTICMEIIITMPFWGIAIGINFETYI